MTKENGTATMNGNGHAEPTKTSPTGIKMSKEGMTGPLNTTHHVSSREERERKREREREEKREEEKVTESDERSWRLEISSSLLQVFLTLLPPFFFHLHLHFRFFPLSCLSCSRGAFALGGPDQVRWDSRRGDGCIPPLPLQRILCLVYCV